MVDEELKGDWVNERDFNPDPLLFVDDEQANAPASAARAIGSPNGDNREFDAFVRLERAAAAARTASRPSR